MTARAAPGWVKIFLILTFALQVVWAALVGRPTASSAALPFPPGETSLRLVALGEPTTLGQLLTLWLQAFDNQPGISIPYAALDYDRVEGWLNRLLQLDPASEYPLMMATQLYGLVPDVAKERRMLEFAHERFLEAPERRWRWMAHATIMAKHRLNDMELALRYAQDLADKTRSPAVPDWARQMRIFILEEMGEVESARILLGGLLASGQITDGQEKRFLIERLNAMQQGETSSKTSRSRLK